MPTTDVIDSADSADSADAEHRARTSATLDRALAHLVDHDMAAFAALWAPEGTMEFPIAGEGWPARLEGREAVAGYLEHYTEAVDVRSIVSQTRHPALDPTTVVVEFVLDGVAVPTQKPFRMAYLALVTVGEEGITSYRDYWSRKAAEETMSGDAEAINQAFAVDAR